MTLCGIYCIRNTSNDKVYIGSSLNVHRRWLTHRNQLRKGTHHSPYLQRAWDASGESCFVFEVIEIVLGSDGLREAETRHIDRAKSADPTYGYNMAPVGGSTRGMKLGPLSEEHRQKIAAGHLGMKVSDESKAKISARHKGRVMSPEWIAKIAVANTGRKMAPLTAEHKAIVSRTHKGKSISPEHKAALSRANKGHIKSPEETAKRKASMLAYWAKRKAQTSGASPV